MDRLAQLKSAAGLATSAPPPPGLSTRNYDPGEDMPLGTEATHVTFIIPPSEEDKETEELLDAFFADVKAIKNSIDTIVMKTDELRKTHADNMQIIDETRSRLLRGDIQRLSEEINAAAKSIKDGLDAMGKNTAKLRESPQSVEANSAVIRIQNNQYNYLLMKFTTVMAEYQRQQTQNEASYKAQTERQIKIKYTNTDGTQIDDVTASNLATQVMENNLTSYIFQQSKDVLAGIIETRNDIYRIEQSMRDLNQLFNDLAFLVNEQGELMDVILANVQASTRYVQKGREELKKARSYQKKSRKKIICLIVCAVVIIVVFVIIGVVAGTIKVR